MPRFRVFDMIVGVGTDILEIARIRRMIGQPSWERFMRRVLTERELALAERRQGRLAEFMAGRFAAKEAVVKAIGCGIGRDVGFRDIEIVPDAAGKPQCTLSAAAVARLGASAGYAWGAADSAANAGGASFGRAIGGTTEVGGASLSGDGAAAESNGLQFVRGSLRIQISISHSGEHAVAFAVAETTTST